MKVAGDVRNLNPPDTDPRLKVFISYSRADMAFADELVAGLEYDGGFEILIDRHAIHEGEAWRSRLGALIADADTIVFGLSSSQLRHPFAGGRWRRPSVFRSVLSPSRLLRWMAHCPLSNWLHSTTFGLMLRRMADLDPSWQA